MPAEPLPTLEGLTSAEDFAELSDRLTRDEVAGFTRAAQALPLSFTAESLRRFGCAKVSFVDEDGAEVPAVIGPAKDDPEARHAAILAERKAVRERGAQLKKRDPEHARRQKEVGATHRRYNDAQRAARLVDAATTGATAPVRARAREHRAAPSRGATQSAGGSRGDPDPGDEPEPPPDEAGRR